jgi:hypothetical protein
MFARRLVVGAALAGLVAVSSAIVATSVVDAAPKYIVWLSPRGFVTGQNIAGGNLTLTSPSGDEEHITTDKAGDLQWVNYPLQLPNDRKIVQVIVCYKLDDATSFISQVRLTMSTIPPTATVMYDDGTDLTSTAGACRSGMVVSGIAVKGEITLGLRLNYASTNHAIDVGAIGIVTK